MSETTPGEVNVEVQGDAVVNTAPDGGGVDNNGAEPPTSQPASPEPPSVEDGKTSI